MSAIPIICMDCKTVFESMFYLKDGITSSMSNFSVICTNCGNPAPILNGTYTNNDSLISISNSDDDELYNGLVDIMSSRLNISDKYNAVSELLTKNYGESLEDIFDDENDTEAKKADILIKFYMLIIASRELYENIDFIQMIINSIVDSLK